MEIIIKNKKHGHIICCLKGEHNVLMKFVKNEYISYISENAEKLVTKRLRTFVLSQKFKFSKFIIYGIKNSNSYRG